MANWRKVAKQAILGDGHIDKQEVAFLREALFADGKINKSELEFLREVRNECKTSVQLFDDLLVDAIKANVLADGDIDAAEVKWLRKVIFSDAKVDDVELRILDELKANASSVSAEFEGLFAECKAKAQGEKK